MATLSDTRPLCQPIQDILYDEEFWASASYEPCQADWDALHEVFESEADARDPEATPALAGHPDRYEDEAPELAPHESFAPWYDFETPEFWAS
jgi:hypothetical protein